MKPLLILGLPRSGTTLLRMMLTHHSEIGIPPESMYLERFTRALGNRMCTVDDLPRITDILHRYNPWSLDTEKLIRAVAGVLPSQVSQISAAVYQNWATQMGKRVAFWGMKEPWRIQHFDRLCEWYEDAYFVHIIRDPRDCVASRVQHYPKQAPYGIGFAPELAFACQWRYLIEEIRRQGPRLAPGRFVAVRYEDLVANSEETLRNILAPLELEFESDMLSYTENVVDPRMLSRADRRSGGHSQLRKRPSENRVGRFRSTLNGWRLAGVEKICRQEMQALGYDFSAGKPPSRMALIFDAARYGFDLAYFASLHVRRLWRTL